MKCVVKLKIRILRNRIFSVGELVFACAKGKDIEFGQVVRRVENLIKNFLYNNVGVDTVQALFWDMLMAKTTEPGKK